MGWTSPRTWVSGEILTAALLNVHLRDNMLGANTTVTNGASVNAAGTVVYQRCGSVLTSVTATTTGALSAAATLFTFPTDYRPPVTWFGELIDTTGDVPVRVTVNTTGIVQVATAVPSGRILRGQIVFPL